MSLASWPKMLLSETEGWSDLARIHPSVTRMFLFYVVPMSLIPPVMYAYAELFHPGVIFPLVEPNLSVTEATLVGVTFFLAELAMVALMAVFIRQMGDSDALRPSYEDAFTLAAVAPTPLWLSSLALFVPSMSFNVAVAGIAWIGSAALIRHGVRPLFRLDDPDRAHHLANSITFTGVVAWIALMLMLAMTLSLVLGWR